jgi:hypothetical protein
MSMTRSYDVIFWEVDKKTKKGKKCLAVVFGPLLGQEEAIEQCKEMYPDFDYLISIEEI